MRVVLSLQQWAELNTDNEELFVRAAFYLSFSYMYIQTRCRADVFYKERQSVIETALEMGMLDEDVVVKGVKRC